MKQSLLILVLTLDDADARRAPLVANLEALGLRYELFFGVDGRESLPPEHEPLIDRSARVSGSRRPMTDAEYACALSHLSMYRVLATRETERAIVLEDDAIVGSSLAAFAAGEIGFVGDLLLLDHRRGLYRRSAPVDLGHGFSAHRVAVAPALTTGYAITIRAVRHFLDHAFPVRRTADWPCDIRGIGSFAVHPRIVDHVRAKAGAASMIRTHRKQIIETHRRRSRTRAWRWMTRAGWAQWTRKRVRHVQKRWFMPLEVTARLDL